MMSTFKMHVVVGFAGKALPASRSRYLVAETHFEARLSD